MIWTYSNNDPVWHTFLWDQGRHHVVDGRMTHHPGTWFSILFIHRITQNYSFHFHVRNSCIIPCTSDRSECAQGDYIWTKSALVQVKMCPQTQPTLCRNIWFWKHYWEKVSYNKDMTNSNSNITTEALNLTHNLQNYFISYIKSTLLEISKT